MAPVRAGPKVNGDLATGFPIVGVGASAGGLEAFTQLLQNLPVDTGMAFVLVQHLDPDHESALTQILGKTTAMKVQEVHHGMRAEPNQVYVIPPDKCMEIVQGVLKLRPRSKRPGQHRSIDVFFECLAKDQRERSIGVVLSGSATDGTHGLEMIKAEGGFTFAQDDSAKFNSMPRSAVAAGSVDLVLSPKQIARELARMASHPLLAARAAGTFASRSSPSVLPPDGEEAFKRILLLLRNQRGVDFSLYKPNTLERRILRRMVLHKLGSLEDYARFLQGHGKELDLLFSDILISVTGFFRNPQAFDVLKQKVFPALLRQDREDEPVRVWTLGCSTGQEAFSIAMAFTEYCDKIPRAPKLQIFATDLNDSVLEIARQGFYSLGQVVDVSPERLKRFFKEEKGGFRLSKSLRDTCVFARHNVLSDPPFSRLDLISCRNMLIYFEAASQKSILPNFHYALKPGGFLFLGASESVGAFASLFVSTDRKEKIFSKKAGSRPNYQLPVSRGHPAAKNRSGGHQPPAQADLRSAESSAQQEADRLMASQYGPPSVVIDAASLEILQFRGSTAAYLESSSGKASFNVLKMARTGLQLPLRAALNKARKDNQPVSRPHVRLEVNRRARLVTLEIVPLENLPKPCYLISFIDETTKAVSEGAATSPLSVDEAAPARAKRSEESRRIRELERGLAEARDYAQTLQEQHDLAAEKLQATSEEAQSVSEEFQSVNEELETSKEELESTNEELTTVNEEMANRNAELNRLNNDLINLQTSTKLPIVLLGLDLKIRHFSPEAQKQFNLLSTDIGRPFGHVRHNLDMSDLEAFIAKVIATRREHSVEVLDKDNRWHILHVHPYITAEHKTDGAVLVLTDINAIKESEQAVVAGREFAEAIIRTARDPFLILDAGLRVEKANEAFYTTFKVSREESVGRTVFKLDHGHWNIPKLRELLLDILPRHSFFNNFEVTHDFEHIGHRTMLLNARTLSETKGQGGRILLGIQDVTELLHFQAQMRRSELRFRRLFEAGRDGVLIIDPETRKILDANPFMTELLGYPHEALLGKELFEIGLLKDEEANRQAFAELQRKGFIRYENLPLETTDGRRREVEFVSNLYHEGQARVIQCNIRDITDRKRMERELREAHAQLQDRAGQLEREVVRRGRRSPAKA